MEPKFFKIIFQFMLELGCGKGEYSLFLAKNPNKNYIGVDIKGSLWKGLNQQ